MHIFQILLKKKSNKDTMHPKEIVGHLVPKEEKTSEDTKDIFANGNNL